jgi:WD40 repeat protein
VLNLLLQLGIDATGFDFSDLHIRQAYLRGADLPRVNFSQAEFEHSVFTDYVGEVMCVAFSPDGQTLAAGADNGVLYFWQVSPQNTLQLTGIYQGHRSQYGGLAFSPDGRYLASGGDDQTVQIWDMRTRSSAHKLLGHTGGVTSVAFHPDGKTVVSGSTDQTARVWDAATGELLHVFNADGLTHTSIIASVACSLDGSLLVTGSHDATIGVWDWHSRGLRQVLRGHTGPIPALCLCERR